MKFVRFGVLGMAAFGLLLVGCNQNTAETKAPEPAPAPVAEAPPAPPPAPPAPPPIPPLTELPINSVDSVTLSRPADAPDAMIIRVLGTTASAGWSQPKLEPMADNGGDASIRSYQFVATSPQSPDDARGATPIETELRVDALPPAVTTIRIVAATNEVSAPVAQ